MSHSLVDMPASDAKGAAAQGASAPATAENIVHRAPAFAAGLRL